MVSLFWFCLILALGATDLFDYPALVAAQPGLKQLVRPSYLDIDPCPVRCTIAGPNPANWSAYRHLDQIQACKHTLFYDFSLYDRVDAPDSSQRIYACTSYGTDWAQLPNSTVAPIPANVVNATYEIGWQSGGRLAAAEIQILSRQMRQYLASGHAATNRAAILFAQLGRAAVGVYIGKGLQNEGVASVSLKALEDQIPALGIDSASLLGMQLCNPGEDADHIFGFMTTSNTSFAPIQEALKSWSNAECLLFHGTKNITSPAFIAISSPGIPTNATSITGGHANSSSTISSGVPQFRRLSARGDCKTIQVVAGDGCASLATKCGISGADITKYNPQSNFCSSLQPLQHICCSAGTLPDFSPKPNADGSCATYTVQSNDNCAGIAAANALTLDQLNTYNTKTWGWNGCSLLWVGTIICLSSGSPPMPAPLTGAKCGPQVPGTTAPPAGTDISTLNPCPLNACCDIWAQCGTTAEFCTNTSTGAPGTAKPGTNGCISNCGTNLVRGDPPAVFRSVGYFEGFGLGRPCLYQDASQVDPSKYTHLHFAFGALTDDYQVQFHDNVTAYEFEQFKLIQGPARILSIGGWDFSTDTGTYNILRQGVTSANRVKLATNIANFVISNNLDGVDIDWEYPAAPDIPGIPPADADGGINYLAFLVVLKNLLPGKSVSIAAPSSYWYLKPFPIATMSKIVDYIVFMTYDLHGQWDAGGQWSQDGCPSGNCLRSHVNLTETISALTMITKAGVPSNKVVVGVASYGRSFAMAEAGCDGPQCFYLGDKNQSSALPGPCTNTAGYISNAEIKAILNDASRVTQSYIDPTSNTNVLVYDNVQWVGWMSSGILGTRTALYQRLNMGGITNWAVDLEDYHDPPARSTSWSDYILDLKAGISPVLPHPSGNWTTVYCNDSAMDVRNYTPLQRWTMMDGDDAWADLIKVWKTVDKPAHSLRFSQSISASINGPPDANCGTFLGTDNCHQTFPCIDSAGVGAAGWAIWNSFNVIHEMYSSYFQALLDASTEVIGPSLPLFQLTFAPVPTPPDDTWVDFVLNLFTLGVSAVAKPFFEGYLAALPAFKLQQSIIDHKDQITDALTKGAETVVKSGDLGSASQWTPADQANFSAYLGDTVIKGWTAATEKAVELLFNGEDDSINTLTTLISGGLFLEGGKNNVPYALPDPSNPPIDSQTGLDTMVARVFWAYAIPAAWSVTDQAVFVIDSGFGCDAIDPIPDLLDTDTMHATGGCYDGRLYYLANAVGAAQACDSGDSVVCRNNKFTAPPGVDSLGSTHFGNVTVLELITGAVRTFIQNGKQNGAPLADPTNDVTWSDLSNQDITTPGFIRLPVCSGDVAFAAWASAVLPSSPVLNMTGYPCVSTS